MEAGDGVMICPMCQSRMTHLGYFLWACASCGHRCMGELPERGRARRAARYDLAFCRLAG